MQSEYGRGTTRWRIDRWDAEAVGWVQRRHHGVVAPRASVFRRHRVMPYLSTEIAGNVITTAGWVRASNLLTNQGSTQALDGTHTRIGAGNGVGSAAASDTDLSASSGSSNRWFQIVDSVGLVSTNTLVFVATFGISDGNFAWTEFGIDVGNTASGAPVAALLYNHKTGIAQGTKASGQIWAATATLTYT